MYLYRWSIILTVAGISGGLFLTLLSGLYTVKPFVVDAEIIYFGFPFPWLEAARSTWVPKPPLSWQYYFLWQRFIIDFIIYGLLTAAAVYLYFIATTAGRKQNKATPPSSS